MGASARTGSGSAATSAARDNGPGNMAAAASSNRSRRPQPFHRRAISEHLTIHIRMRARNDNGVDQQARLGDHRATGVDSGLHGGNIAG